MARVVNSEYANEAVRAKLESCDAAISCGNPDGAKLRRVESAHQVKRENADSARVREDNDALAPVLLNRPVQSARGAVEHLSIAFAAQQNVVEVAANQRGVLFRMLCGCFFKRQAFYHADAAFAKSFRLLYVKTCQARERHSGFDRTREVRRIDCVDVFRRESLRSRFRLKATASGEWGCRVSAEASLRVALGLTVPYEKDAGGFHRTVKVTGEVTGTSNLGRHRFSF